jgi:hypothetical protein
VAYDYRRRTELAREKGFANYTEYRNATEYAFERGRFRGTNSGRDFETFATWTPPVIRRNEIVEPGRYRGDQVRAYWLAFGRASHGTRSKRKEWEKDYSVVTRNRRVVIGPTGKGAKAYWLINVAGYVPNATVWRALYPRGLRGRKQ